MCFGFPALPVSVCACVSHSVVFNSVSPRTVTHQAPLSKGFSRQNYWSGLPFPSPGDLPYPGIEPESPSSQVDSLLTELQGKQLINMMHIGRAENFRIMISHCQVKEENDYSLHWLDLFFTQWPWPHNFIQGFSVQCFTWLCEELEKYKSAMRNNTSLPTFILLDWQMTLQCRF